MNTKVDWAKAVKPLIKKYKEHTHPLEAKNLYQMLVMVVLSAQTSDRAINLIAPKFFKVFPTLHSLVKHTPEDLHPYLKQVRNFGNKSSWLIGIAKQLQKDSAIPTTMEELYRLPGIGRKSANVIKRFAGAEIEGIVVDLHTIRVCLRLGITTGTDPKIIENRLMETLPKSTWDAGMCMSFLGRELCRAVNPLCDICVMNKVCAYYQSIKN